MDANLTAARQHAELSREALDAGRLLLAHDLYRSSIDRRHHAAFHAANALLHGIYPGSHDGVIAMLALHFVKAGALPKASGRALRDLYNRRLIADDKGYLEQDAGEAQACLKQAEDFADRLLALIEPG